MQEFVKWSRETHSLFLRKRDLLARRHLAARHRVAVRQMQWGDWIAGQQLLASLESGARTVDIAGVEQRERLVKSGLS